MIISPGAGSAAAFDFCIVGQRCGAAVIDSAASAGCTSADRPAGHLKITVICHLYTAAAFTGAAPHDISAFHYKACPRRHKHAAAAIIIDNLANIIVIFIRAPRAAGNDPALNDLGARVFVQRPKAGGLLDEFVYGVGVTVHQRQRAALYLDNAVVCVSVFMLQHKSVQVQRHILRDYQRIADVNVAFQLDGCHRSVSQRRRQFTLGANARGRLRRPRCGAEHRSQTACQYQRQKSSFHPFAPFAPVRAEARASYPLSLSIPDFPVSTTRICK